MKIRFSRGCWAAFGLAGLLAAASVGIVACADHGADTEMLPECSFPADAVTPELLAFLSRARASHKRADLAMKDKDTERAIVALDALVDGPRPPGEPSPEIREVVADTLARSAELRSQIGQFDEAKADIERGLDLAVERTHYRGRLMEVLGAVESRLHDKLEADIAERVEAGESRDDMSELTTAADEAKKRAIAASLKAIDIQEEVINKALAEDPLPTLDE